MTKELQVGQIWWDKDRCWTSGSKTLNSIHLLLSADCETFENPHERIYFWSAAEFAWCRDGYMGASIRKFTEKEIRKMHYVGKIEQVKSFSKE